MLPILYFISLFRLSDTDQSFIFLLLFFDLLPSATVVAERLCFHRCLSVQRDGLGVHLPPLPGRHPLWQTPRRAHTPCQADPPDKHPQADTIPRDDYCSGLYAPYWNAFLFSKMFLDIYVLFLFSFILLFHIHFIRAQPGFPNPCGV